MRIGLLFIMCLLFTISCTTLPDTTTEEQPTARSVEPYSSSNNSGDLVFPEGTSIRDTQRGKVLNTDPKILFKFASTQMPSNSEGTFAKVIEFMNNNPNVNIVVEAHTSNRGEAYPANYELSVARVRLAKTYLIENGISADRIIEQPLGESLPEYSSQNDLRRYEFVIIESDDDLKNYNNFVSTLDITKESSY